MKRIESLTFLRFIAAFIVVMFHYGENTVIANYANPFITAGPQMVSLFFVLSGFVMTVAYYNKNDWTLRDYYISRIARIVPVYLLALSLSVYLFYGVANNNLTALLLSLIFLQSWFPPYPLSLNTPAWSLSVEVLFYLTFPFVLFAIKKSNISWKTLAILSLLFYFFTQAILSNLLNVGFYRGYPSTSHDLIYYFPLSHYCSFLLGVSGGFVYAKHMDWFNKTGFLSFVILMSALFVNYMSLQYPSTLTKMVGFPLAYSSSFYSLLFLLLILSLAYSKNIITRIMSMPFFVLLGEASYSLYILQKPLYNIYSVYISGYIYKYLKMSPDERFYFFVFLLVAISIVSFYVIEKPGKQVILKLDAYLKEKTISV